MFAPSHPLMDAGPALSHLRQLAAGAEVPLSADEQRLLLSARQSRDSLAQVATPDEQQVDCAAVLGALRRLACSPLDVAGSGLEGVRGGDQGTVLA